MSRPKLMLLGVTAACALCAGTALSGPREGVVLTMAANASGRPRECAGPGNAAERAWHPTIWDNARQPQLRRYCDLIGRAQARLSQAPVAAREAATVADRILPGYASPWVVMARADVAVHRFEDALKEFERARTIDARSVEEPQALHDLAVAQRQSGKLTDALSTYRALVPRLGLLSSVQDRTLVLLEAASVAMSQDDGLREAISLLAEARSNPASKLDPDVLALLALALDRAGTAAQAAEMVELMRARGLELTPPERESTAYGYLVQADDAIAMVAISIERSDPRKAAEYWERFVSREGVTKWKDHAKRHLDAARAAAAKKGRGPVAPPRPAGASR
ncbi:MAG: hypothetical protein HY898_19595 [Deltaproteobacteria bacterium]|nr:hypothetical protein [Deltaproteobacteria bacterium]